MDASVTGPAQTPRGGTKAREVRQQHTTPHKSHTPSPPQDFLRSIPLKLLSCDLFEEWMGALEKQNEEDRIEALKQ